MTSYGKRQMHASKIHAARTIAHVHVRATVLFERKNKSLLIIRDAEGVVIMLHGSARSAPPGRHGSWCTAATGSVQT